MVTLLVETGHLYFCLSKRFPKRKLSYEKYLDFVSEKFGEVTKAVAFVPEANHDSDQFMKYLNSVGFTVVSKKPIKHKVHDKTFYKTNFAIEIAIAALTCSNNTIVVGTTNQDIVPLFAVDTKKFGVVASGIPGNFSAAVAGNAHEIQEGLLA